MNVVTRGVRNTFRNSIRTVSIVLILALVIGLSMAMLLARQAVEQKIESVKQSIGNTITVSPAGVQGFEGGGDALTTDQITTISHLTHVAGTVSTFSDRLQSTDTSLQSSIDAGSLGMRFNRGRRAGVNQTFTPPIQITGTTDPAALAGIGNVSLKTGTQIDGTSNNNDAEIGSGLADKNNLAVGSTFTTFGQTMTVKGILNTSDNRFASNIVVVPLTTLQRLSGQANAVTNAVVTVDSIENTDSVVASIKGALGDKADVVSQASAAETALAPLNSIRNVALFALVASVAAGAVIILLTMIMIVRERKREIGVLKAIGATNTAVAAQFMVEASTFTLVAAVIGIGLGVLLANPITDTLVNNAQSAVRNTAQTAGGVMTGMRFTPGQFRFGGLNLANLQNITTNISWNIITYGLLAALLLALVGSGVAAWFITKIKPADAIRSE